MPRLVALASIAWLLTANPAAAVSEIHWWHAMAGELGREVERLAADFNLSQSEYKIVPTYKGPYTETMTAAMFALRSKQHPAILQTAEVATATMMAAKGAVFPVHQLMREQGMEFTSASFLPAVAGYYSEAGGDMLSFPFNASTPILY
jgi:sn-glycerol 3-phosphate transport system substrate-binding protein